MPSYADTHIEKEQFVNCIDEAKKLLIGKVVKVGDRFGWPLVYERAFSNQDLGLKLIDLFEAYGFNASVNGLGQFEVTSVNI